jgi:uncharacterized protein YjbI with pentapeptide repeats
VAAQTPSKRPAVGRIALVASSRARAKFPLFQRCSARRRRECRSLSSHRDREHFPDPERTARPPAVSTTQLGLSLLRVDYRTLVDHVWDSKAMVDLRAPGAELTKSLAGIEGLVLRDRSLRFAVLEGSRLYAADLAGSDLRNAKLIGSDLSGANLSYTKLQDADLSNAHLQEADLKQAQLQGASLWEANLRGADLNSALLRCAVLILAELQGATLRLAALQGADLNDAHLQGADLSQAQLQDANLSNAHLGGADLFQAQLQDADLSDAHLQGANLQGVKLWHAHSTKPADLTLGDVRGADFTTQTDERGNQRQSYSTKKTAVYSLAPPEPLGGFDFVASHERPVLVSAPPEPALAAHPDWLTTEPTAAYMETLVGYLASELATPDPTIAARIATDLEMNMSIVPAPNMPVDPRSLARNVPIACRLLSEAKAGRVRLEKNLIDRLSRALKDAKQDCPSVPPAVSEAK